MSSNIILVLGAGPNIGLHTIKYFSSKGFKTAAASRNPSAELASAADLVVKCDFADPASIKGLFEAVKEKLGVPNVVVYNAYACPTDLDPFAVSLGDFTAGMNINLMSPYVAIQEAIKGFGELGSSDGILNTFIYTGNCSPHVTVPAIMNLGVAKTGMAYMVEAAGMAYKEEGYR